MIAECGARVTGSELFVKVSNHGGGASAITLAIEPASYRSEGTNTDPLQIALGDLPHSGQVEETEVSVYEITGLDPGLRYLARVFDVDGSDLYVSFSKAPAADEQCAIETHGSKQCALPKGQSSIFVRVVTSGHPEHSAIGSLFSLNLTAIPEGPGGTPSAPIILECPGGGAYEGHVAAQDSNYYEVTGLESGRSYFVEVLAEDFFELRVLSNPTSQPFSAEGCSSYGQTLTPYAVARCTAVAQNGRLFVLVTGAPGGTPFELRVSPSMQGSDGTSSAPVELDVADPPYPTRVGSAQASYYEITGFEVGKAYIANVATAHELVDVWMYRLGFEPGDGEILYTQVRPGEPLNTVFVASDSNAFMRNALSPNTDGITNMTIDFVLSPHQSEGVSSPLVLSLGDLPHAGEVDSARYTRYSVTACCRARATSPAHQRYEPEREARRVGRRWFHPRGLLHRGHGDVQPVRVHVHAARQHGLTRSRYRKRNERCLRPRRAIGTLATRFSSRGSPAARATPSDGSALRPRNSSQQTDPSYARARRAGRASAWPRAARARHGASA